MNLSYEMEHKSEIFNNNVKWTEYRSEINKNEMKNEAGSGRLELKRNSRSNYCCFAVHVKIDTWNAYLKDLVRYNI